LEDTVRSDRDYKKVQAAERELQYLDNCRRVLDTRHLCKIRMRAGGL